MAALGLQASRDDLLRFCDADREVAVAVGSQQFEAVLAALLLRVRDAADHDRRGGRPLLGIAAARAHKRALPPQPPHPSSCIDGP